MVMRPIGKQDVKGHLLSHTGFLLKLIFKLILFNQFNYDGIVFAFCRYIYNLFLFLRTTFAIFCNSSCVSSGSRSSLSKNSATLFFVHTLDISIK